MNYLVYCLLILVACVGGNAFSAEPKSSKWKAVASISLLSDNDKDSPVFFNIGAWRQSTQNWIGGFNVGTNFSIDDLSDQTGAHTELKFVAGAHVGRYVYSSESIKTRLALESGFAVIDVLDTTPGVASAASEPVIFIEPKIIFEANKAFKNKARAFLEVSYLQTITDPETNIPDLEAFKTFKLTIGISK